MGKMQLLEDFDLVISPSADGRGRPLANSVDSEDCGFAERRREEGAGGMREVVLGIINRDFSLSELTQLFFQHSPHEELFLNPNRNRRCKASDALRSEGVICFEQPLEFHKWLLIERHRRKIPISQARFLQDIAAGVRRKG